MRNKKFVMLVVVLSAIATLGAACGPGGGGGGAPAPATFNVSATEFKYDPPSLNANAGQQVTVNLNNTGSVKHTFVLTEANVKIVAEAGQTQSASFTAPKAGTYQFFCDEPGHKEAGMIGTFTVK